MTIVALGMPGGFSAWGFEALRLLLQVTRPEHVQHWIDRFDGYELDPDARAFVCSQFPSRGLRTAMLEHALPAILFTTSAAEAVSHQLAHHQGSLLEAVRTVGASVALIGDCRGQGRTLVLDEFDALGAEQLVLVLALHLEISLPGSALAAVFAALGPPPTRQTAARPLTEREEATVTPVLDSAVAHLRDPTAPLGSVWPHRIFLSGDKPDQEAPLVTDATGGSRILYYGPYLHLAEGHWRAKLTLGFTREAVGLPLKIAAYGPQLLGEARLRPSQEGIFAAEFSFPVAEPEHPVEFHIRTEEGAIEGRIALGQAELTHLGPAHPAR